MTLLTLLSDNPALRALQLMLLVAAVVSVYLVLFTTRDSILRSESFWFQLVSIMLVACLPVVGFLLYVLYRPSQTLMEKELHQNIRTLLARTRVESGKGKVESEKKKEPEQSVA